MARQNCLLGEEVPFSVSYHAIAQGKGELVLPGCAAWHMPVQIDFFFLGIPAFPCHSMPGHCAWLVSWEKTCIYF